MSTTENRTYPQPREGVTGRTLDDDEWSGSGTAAPGKGSTPDLR